LLPGRHSTLFAGRNQERSKLGTAGLFARASSASGPGVKRPCQERPVDCLSWAWSMWRTVVETSLRSIPNIFGNFWLTIQNTTNRHVSNAFDLLAVFISFPLARAAAVVAAADFCCCCAPRPHPAPLLLGEGSTNIKLNRL
jgi:hypothetical protein